MRLRSLKPPQVVRDDLRGGQCWSIEGDTVTLRVHAEQHDIRDYDVPRSMAPTVVCGDSVVVKIAGSYPYAIVAVAATTFADSAPSDQAGGVARGIFSPGRVPLAEGESPYWWEADGGG